jgi:hypothetical protein
MIRSKEDRFYTDGIRIARSRERVWACPTRARPGELHKWANVIRAANIWADWSAASGSCRPPRWDAVQHTTARASKLSKRGSVPERRRNPLQQT